MRFALDFLKNKGGRCPLTSAPSFTATVLDEDEDGGDGRCKSSLNFGDLWFRTGREYRRSPVRSVAVVRRSGYPARRMPGVLRRLVRN